MADLQIGSARAGAGEVGFGSIPVSELNDGSPIEVPVCVIRGAADGPCLWIQNGVHGDEYVGAAAIGRLIREVDPTRLRGTLVLIPELNIQAFRAGTRMAPQDGLDMNRIWPGAPIERAMHLWAHTELAAHTVLQHILKHATVLLDVHDAGWMGLMSPYVAYYKGPTPEFEQPVKALAVASGMDLIWETVPEWVSEKVPGSIKTQMTKAQIPSVTLEVGGEGRVKPEHVDRMYRSFTNILRHLEMLPGDPELPPQRVFVNRATWIRAPIGGYLFTHVNPLDRVEEGHPLATITDLFGRPRQVLTAPTAGWIVGVRTFGTVATGQYITNVSRYIEA